MKTINNLSFDFKSDINEANKWIELATSQGYDYSKSSLGAWYQEQES